jgi:hypothetical protein
MPEFESESSFAHNPEHAAAPFGPTEKQLGVAANRKIHDPHWDKEPTTVHYSAYSTYIEIDLERDPSLVHFLDKIKQDVGESSTPTPLLAERVTRQVVAETPEVDYDGTYHESRHLTLGEALEQPVLCIDRCLAMEAALDMYGFSDVAHLPSFDPKEVGDEAHVDISFSFEDEKFVAITMGEAAGSVMPMDFYKDSYLKPSRKLQEHFAVTFFQPVD